MPTDVRHKPLTDYQEWEEERRRLEERRRVRQERASAPRKGVIVLLRDWLRK